MGKWLDNYLASRGYPAKPLKVRANRKRRKWSKLWILAQLRLQKGRCHWCGRVMNTTDHLSPLYRTVEHLIPRCKGGTHAPDNCMLACRECNERRGDGTPPLERENRVRQLLGFKPISAVSASGEPNAR